MSEEHKENEREYYPIIKQYFIIGIVSIFLGNSVPARYDNNPECFIYVLLLTVILLGIWGSSLGTTEIHSSKVCVIRSAKRLNGHSSHISAIAISEGLHPKIVSASWDNTIRVWDLHTGDHLLTYTEHSCRVFCVAITSSGLVVSCGQNQNIHVWNINTGITYKILIGHLRAVLALSISNTFFFSNQLTYYNEIPSNPKNSSVVASGGEDGQIILWNLDNFEMFATFHHPYRNQPSPIVSIYLSKSSNPLIVSGSVGGTIALFDVLTQQLLHVFEGHFGPVSSVVIYEETEDILSTCREPKSLLVSSSADWTIRIWDLHSKQLINTLEGHSGGVECLALYTPFSNIRSHNKSTITHYPLIVSGGRDATIRVWDLETGVLYRNLEDHSDIVHSVAVSSTDTRPMVVSGVHSLAITTNNSRPIIVSGGANSCLQLWNLDKIICDINWERRKHFGHFIYFIRHTDEVIFSQQVSCLTTSSPSSSSSSQPSSSSSSLSQPSSQPSSSSSSPSSSLTITTTSSSSFSSPINLNQGSKNTNIKMDINNTSINQTNIVIGTNIKYSSRGNPLIKAFTIDNVCYHIASYL